MSDELRAVRAESGRRELLNIAIDCFARYGYRGTSIDRIAKAAGLTKGAIYYHYKDKEDLLLEAVKDRVGQFESCVTGKLLPVADAESALRGVARICLDHATASNHRRFIVTLMVEALETNARLSAQFREMMSRFRGFLQDIIEAGQRQGVFRANANAVDTASVYAGAVMGAEIQYYQDPDGIDLAAVLETFLDECLAQLRNPQKT